MPVNFVSTEAKLILYHRAYFDWTSKSTVFSLQLALLQCYGSHSMLVHTPVSVFDMNAEPGE